MTEKNVDTIYQYTESHVKALEDTLIRLNNRFSTFLGFSCILMRLALSLPDECPPTIKAGIFLFAMISIGLSTVGLTAKSSGSVLHPEFLMEDETFEKDGLYHQCLIINDRIALIKEYEQLIYRNGQKVNFMVGSFAFAALLYGIGASFFSNMPNTLQ